MIEHTEGEPRFFAEVKLVNRLERLHEAQETESAVERAGFAGGSNHGGRMAVDFHRTNDEALCPQAAELLVHLQAGDDGGTFRRAHDHRAIAVHLRQHGDRRAQQSGAGIGEFGPNGIQGGRVARHDQRGNVGAIGVEVLRGQKIIAHPKAITVFRPGSGWEERLNHDGESKETEQGELPGEKFGKQEKSVHGQLIIWRFGDGQWKHNNGRQGFVAKEFRQKTWSEGHSPLSGKAEGENLKTHYLLRKWIAARKELRALPAPLPAA